MVYKNYLDVLRRLPRLMEKFRLPALDVEGFTWPAAARVPVKRPDRLYDAFRALVSRRRI